MRFGWKLYGADRAEGAVGHCGVSFFHRCFGGVGFGAERLENNCLSRKRDIYVDTRE